MAKDRKPEDARAARGPSGRGGNGPRPAGGGTGGDRAPRRPAANVVSPQRPWGLIAAAIAVVVFAGAVLTYAIVQVRKADAARIDSVDEIGGVVSAEYAAGQEHVPTPVEYAESPPVGGPHDGEWADCTGTVYEVEIRHENAVHSLEHGAVWVTYDPEQVADDDVAALSQLVEGRSYRLMSPYEGLSSPISIQAWNHSLAVDSADDPRLAQFADFLAQNPDNTPEPGATCENPTFAADPLVVGDGSRGGEAPPTDASGTPTPTDASGTPTAGTEGGADGTSAP